MGFLDFRRQKSYMLIFGNRLLKARKSPSVLSSFSSYSFSRFPRRLIHTSTLSMVAHKIDGTAIAKFVNLLLTQADRRTDLFVSKLKMRL